MLLLPLLVGISVGHRLSAFGGFSPCRYQAIDRDINRSRRFFCDPPVSSACPSKSEYALSGFVLLESSSSPCRKFLEKEKLKRSFYPCRNSQK